MHSRKLPQQSPCAPGPSKAMWFAPGNPRCLPAIPENPQTDRLRFPPTWAFFTTAELQPISLSPSLLCRIRLLSKGPKRPSFSPSSIFSWPRHFFSASSSPTAFPRSSAFFCGSFPRFSQPLQHSPLLKSSQDPDFSVFPRFLEIVAPSSLRPLSGFCSAVGSPPPLCYIYVAAGTSDGCQPGALVTGAGRQATEATTPSAISASSLAVRIPWPPGAPRGRGRTTGPGARARAGCG